MKLSYRDYLELRDQARAVYEILDEEERLDLDEDDFEMIRRHFYDARKILLTKTKR